MTLYCFKKIGFYKTKFSVYLCVSLCFLSATLRYSYYAESHRESQSR